MLEFSTKGETPDKAGEMLALVTINAIPMWRDAQSGRTFPQIAGAEDPPGGGSDSDGDDADEHADDDDTADAEKLRRRVQAQRAGEKRLKDLLKTQGQELEALRAVQRQRDDADKSELEKAQARLAERETAHAEAEAKLKRVLISQAIERAARKHNARNPEVVARLIDHDALEFNEAGEPTNAEELVKALLKAETYLVGTGSGSGGVPSTPRSNGQPAGHDDKVKENREKLIASGDYNPL